MIKQPQLVSMLLVIVGAILIIISPFYIYRKDLKGVMKTYFTGAMVFFIGDSMLRYSAINLLQFDNLVLNIIVRSVISVAIAILFRIFVLKGVLDKERQEKPFKTGVVLGLGQAAMEGFVVAYQYLTQFQISNAINNGTIYDLVSETITRTQIDEVIEVLQNTSVLEILGSIIILALYVFIHIGFSLMIISALRNNDKKQFGLISILYLALVLSETILVSTQQSMILRILVVFIFSVLMGYYILKEKQHAKV